jgi:hypothetical protein
MLYFFIPTHPRNRNDVLWNHDLVTLADTIPLYLFSLSFFFFFLSSTLMMSLTFPVHSISFCAGWSNLESIHFLLLRGSPLKIQALLISLGLSSLSSSSTIKTITTVDEVKSVWDIPGIEKIGTASLSTSQLWKCCWCNSKFKGWNTTKVMNNVLKAGQNDIKVCTGRITKETLLLFQAYWSHANVILSVKRQQSKAFVDSIA